MATIQINLGHGLVDVEDGGDIDLDVEERYLADGTRLTEAEAERWAEDILRRRAAEREQHAKAG